jgi:hypothetical protein
MSTAWIVKPLAISAISLVSGTTTAAGALMNLADDTAGIVWKSNTGSTVAIIFDMGSDVTIDTLALFGILGPPAPAQMQIRAATAAQGNAFSGGVGTGANQYWQSATETLYAGTVTPKSGRRMALWSAPASSGPPAARYWMLTVSALSSSYLQAARAVFGQRFVPGQNFAADPTTGVRDFGSADFSNRGVLIRRRSVKQRSISLVFEGLTKAEVEASIQPLMQDVGNTDAIAVIADPAADAQRENRMYFGPMLGDLATIWRSFPNHEWRCQVASLF